MSTIVVVSGYFNPIHLGHVRLLRAASELGDKLVVIVNNDHQQVLKKGKIIMDETERLEVVRAIRYIDEARLAVDQDLTVVQTLEEVAQEHSDHSLIFANGGDRGSVGDVPETSICVRYGIEMLFDVGGTDKLNSSSNVNKLRDEE